MGRSRPGRRKALIPEKTMATRMALRFVISLVLMLQASIDYPTKPVRLIEPFGAGGGPDLLCRVLAKKLNELYGQYVTVLNVSGAGATEGLAQVAKSLTD